MKRVLSLNSAGLRVGESHQRAKLTDAEVDAIRDLLDERDRFAALLRNAGWGREAIRRAVVWQRLDVRSIARMFEVGSSTVQDIYTCKRRAQVAVSHKLVRLPDE